MSDDLDLDMEVVEDDELDELGADGASSAGRHSRSEKESMSKEDSSRTENVSPSNSQSAGSESEDSKGDFERLGEFVEFINGNKPDRVLEKPSDDAEPYLTVETLRDGELKYAIDETAPRASPDDVLMIMDGSGSGRVYPGREGIISSTFSALKISQLCPEYVRYFLEHNFRRINSATKGSAVPHTDKDLVRSLEIPSVEIDEQHKIASVLYAVDQAIQKTEAIIEQAKRVKRGLLQDLFSFGVGSDDRLRDPDQNPGSFRETKLGSLPSDWEVIPMGKAISTLYRYPSYYDIEYVDKGVPEVRGELLRPDGTINLSTEEIRYVSEETASEYPRVRLEENDFVISVRGTVGKVGRIPPSLAGGVITANLIRVKFDTDLILPDYAQVMLLSRQFQRRLDALTSATTIKTIKADDLRRIPVRLPNFSEQQRISKVVQSRTEKVRKEQAQLDELLRLKKGLMQNLLTGEVRTMNKAIEVLGEVKAHG